MWLFFGALGLSLLIVAIEAYNKRTLGTKPERREVVTGAEAIEARGRMLALTLKMNACLRDLRRSLSAGDDAETARLDAEFEAGLQSLYALEIEIFGPE